MISLEEAARSFLSAQRANGARATTVRWYRNMLMPLVARFYHKAIAALSANDLREYIGDLRERKQRFIDAPQRPTENGGLSHETLRSHHRALKRFFNWCWEEYTLAPDSNPMRRIKLPPREQAEPKAIDLNDLRRLFEAAARCRTARRDLALLAFLTDTGCRAHGVISLRMVGLHLEDCYAIVTEKGRRTRIVPFTPTTRLLLAQWLLVRPAQAGNYVFCTLGTSVRHTPLTYSGLVQLLKRLKKAAGVRGRVNPHSFRHGFARQYLMNGGDLGTLSKILGHSDLNVTTSFYTLFTRVELATFHNRFSPIQDVLKEIGDER